jgi:hypothetical protein
MPNTIQCIASNGFQLWKRKETEAGRSISLEAIAKETGLSIHTVRRFLCVPDSDVAGSPLSAAAKLALFFDVSLSDLLVVHSQAKEDCESR